MISKKFSLVFIFLLSLTIKAQNKIELKSFLVKIEKQHDVKFTYSDDDLTGNVITTPQKKLVFKRGD